MRFIRYFSLVILTCLLVINILPSVNASLVYSAHHSNLIAAIPNSSLILVEKGKRFYDKGEFTSAAKIWEQAISKIVGKGEAQNRANIYRYLAIVYQDLGQWEAAKKSVNQALELSATINNQLLHAQILNTQAKLQMNLGQTTSALENWQTAESIYRSRQDTTGIILTQINQAQALQNLGFYRRARTILEQVNQNLQTSPDILFKIQGLRSLGITLEAIGDLEASQEILLKSLALAKQIKDNGEIGANLLSLGNTQLSLSDFISAAQSYQQVTQTTNNNLTKTSAQINQLYLLVKTRKTQQANNLIPKIQSNLNQIPPSRSAVYMQVNFANTLMDLWSLQGKPDKTQIVQILVTALHQAKQLQDPIAQSYVMGELGFIYEQNHQYSEALKLTQEALKISNNLQAMEINANLYWQQGRIFKHENKLENAIKSYEQAITGIESLRQYLVGIDTKISNKRFNFRQQVEPVYRQLVELLLENIDQLPTTIQQQNLEKSRILIESLQQQELENFFRAACLDARKQKIDQIDKHAAVIYPILLEKRLEVIISIPKQPLQHYFTDISEAERMEIFQDLRKYLNPVFKSTDILPAAQKAYNLLVRPAEKYLANRDIKTLVFVLDGYLRNLPMGILHDGKKYLIEKYAIALTPGLQLLLANQFVPEKFATLTAGLTTARQGFSPLPAVDSEISQISQLLPTKVLLNETFTENSVEQKVKNQPFSVLHFATHGQFSSNAKDTFLLTWDSKINVNDINRLLKRKNTEPPIELLVLSACKTAKGDDKAILGLAGIAVRSGARSTLATLWSIRDKSTAELISRFYQQIVLSGNTKAEALRQAQLSLLNSNRYKHPYYWSPFILVGNWG